MKLNHYHLVLRNPSSYILMEADVPFTETEQLQQTMKSWAGVWDSHILELWRGRRYQKYRRRVLDSNHHFTWEKYGTVEWGSKRDFPFEY